MTILYEVDNQVHADTFGFTNQMAIYHWMKDPISDLNDATVSKIGFNIKKANSPPATNLYVQILDPDNNVKATSSVKTDADVSTDYSFVDFDISYTFPSDTTDYCCGIYTTTSGLAGNNYYFALSNTTNDDENHYQSSQDAGSPNRTCTTCYQANVRYTGGSASGSGTRLPPPPAFVRL